MRFIDLRSDTVTQPTDGMREAMARAAVGDDVYDEDPTVNRLQEMMAQRVGMDAGLFVASGTMGNLVAVLSHAGRGDEMILGSLAHTYLYEVGAAAGLGGVHPWPIPNAPDGTLPLDAITTAIRDVNVHFPTTRLLCLENTHNRCGGAVLPLDYTAAACELAHAHEMAVHLDGARLFNAAAAAGRTPAELARGVDSVMICLSKGLGAPVGSILCGSRAFIGIAKRVRKMVGGGMRQVGVIAAAGIYALEHHVERLAVDHENARRLAAGIEAIPGLKLLSPPATNLVYLEVDPAQTGDASIDAASLSNRLKPQGVLANPLGSNRYQMRMVTHLDVSAADIDQALAALRTALR